MKALVTGAAGFVGSAISRRLLAEGHEVVGVDSVTDYYDVALKEGNLATLDHPAFTLVRGDLNEIDIAALLPDVELVFHQAGQPGVRKSWGASFSEYTRQNVDATQRLLEAAREAPRLKRLVYASSSSVYGDAERYPTSENDLPQPISPYGVTKLAAEHLVRLYGTGYGVPTASLRYFTVFGPGQRPDMAFTRFVRAAVTGGEITIFGDGTQVRDFTFIDDVVDANIRVGLSDVPAGSVFNVAGGSNVSVNEVLETLAGIHGSALNVTYIDSVLGDVRRTGGDISAITSAVGWTAQTSLNEGLARQYEWGRSVFTA